MDNTGVDRVRRGDSADKPASSPRDAELDGLRAEIQSLSAEIMELKSRIGDYCGREAAPDGIRDSSLRGALGDIQARADEAAVIDQGISVTEESPGQPIQPPVEIRVGNVVCPSCGARNDMWAKSCASCGSGFKADAAAHGAPAGHKPGQDGVCPLCGANLYEEAIFCYTCGAMVQI